MAQQGAAVYNDWFLERVFVPAPKQAYAAKHRLQCFVAATRVAVPTAHVFGSHRSRSGMKLAFAIAVQVYASHDGQYFFANDFVAAWIKAINLNRFDLN